MTFFFLECLLQQKKKIPIFPCTCIARTLSLMHRTSSPQSIWYFHLALWNRPCWKSLFQQTLWTCAVSILLQILLPSLFDHSDTSHLHSWFSELEGSQACPYFSFLSHHPYSQLCNCISIHHFLPMSNISCIVIPCGSCTSLEATWIWLTVGDCGVCFFVVKC